MEIEIIYCFHFNTPKFAAIVETENNFFYYFHTFNDNMFCYSDKFCLRNLQL